MASYPKIKAYPYCSSCGRAYVLRLSLAFLPQARKWLEEWLWVRDCKHKKAEPLLFSATTKRIRRKR